jgi:transcriptional regulator with XRE-family HTH domain
MARKKAAGVEEQLRQALRESQKTGLSLYALAKVTGVGADRISRFARGERGVGLGVFSRLCEALGLELTRRKGPPPGRSQ